MNADKLNMYAAAIIGSTLVFLLLHFFAGQVFGTRYHHEGEPLAFAVEVEDAGGAEAAGAEIDWPALVASADAAAGEKVFKKCTACHKLEDGANGVGPHLWGVVGRDIASVDGYAFSDALAAVEGDWTLEALSAFLENPKGYAPGTKMSFAGLKKAEDRVNLIVYMNDADGSPIELASAPAETASDASTDTAETTETTSESTEVAATASGDGDGHADAAITGDPAAGKDVFRKCRACHVVEEGVNRLGPSLHAIVGRDIASVEGFKYSDALTAAEGDWTVAQIDAFLENPRSAIPGNKMTFPGLKDAEDRANVIAYLSDPAGGDGAAATGTTESAATTGETQGASTEGTAESTTEGATEATGGTSGTEVAAASGSVDYSNADAEAGEKVFRKCRACHKVEEGKNGVGPSLWGIVGRDKGTVDGFKYSDAMLNAPGDWTASDLDAYLKDPKGFMPGNRMSFPGLKKDEDRVNVIQYLNEADGTPEPLN